ncbi:MAG: TolB family protein [Fimbriimonadaceae bacterium]
MLSGLAALFIYFPVQSQVKDLPSGPEPTAFLSFSFSPDSKQILYAKVDDAKNFDPQKRNIWVAKADGSGAHVVASGVGAAEWANNANTIMYLRNMPNGNDLCIFDLKSKKETSVGLKLPLRSAHCCPTTGKLVFMADVSKDAIQSFTCNLDGSDVRQVTFGPGKAYNPIWSPDGKRIAFFRELGDGKDQVYVMNQNGSNLRRISNPAEHNFYPDFGANGTVSFTIQKSESDKTIVICNDRGRVMRQFPFRTSRLRWSPDGKTAIFAAGEFPTMALYVSDADGSNPKRIGN